jgi:outer membrane immunogenic protein
MASSAASPVAPRVACAAATLRSIGRVVAVSFSLFLPGAAFAGDLPAAPPAPAEPAPAFSWTGFYIGGELGWARPEAMYDFTIASPNNGRDRSSPNSTKNGILGGGFAGYNYQSDRLVIGAEADIDFVISGKIRTAAGKSFITAHTNFFGSARGRLGWAADRVLLYGTGGLAFQSPVTRVPTTAISVRTSDDLRLGWTAGAGAEYAMSDNWIAGVEYRHSEYETESASYRLRRTRVRFSQDKDVNQVVGRLSYKF